MSRLYEIEVKSLLGDAQRALSLKDKIKQRGATLTGQSKQLNHYFNVSEIARFKEILRPHIPEAEIAAFDTILDEGSGFSIRTRDADGKVLLVIKASIGDDTSSNGVSRMEFEAHMPMTLEELDKLLLSAGLTYQAKWSREREEYGLDGVNICLDKNAGYGYLAEFERVVEDKEDTESAKQMLLDLMREVGAEELPQDRLERMFSYYNENWRDYYGTDKVFNVE